MTREEALQAMRAGYKVRHTYYSDNEYVYMDNNNHLITEEGCDHGTIYDEFWTKYQQFEDGWEKCGETTLSEFYNQKDPYIKEFLDQRIPDYQESFYHCSPRRVDPIPQRNEPCPCNSGLKYKKCCGNLLKLN